MIVAFGDTVASGFCLNGDKMALWYVSQNTLSRAFLPSKDLFICVYLHVLYVYMYVYTMQYLRSPEEGVRSPDDPQLPLGAGN